MQFINYGARKNALRVTYILSPFGFYSLIGLSCTYNRPT